MKVLQVMIVTKKVIILRLFCPAFISSSNKIITRKEVILQENFEIFFEIFLGFFGRVKPTAETWGK